MRPFAASTAATRLIVSICTYAELCGAGVVEFQHVSADVTADVTAGVVMCLPDERDGVVHHARLPSQHPRRCRHCSVHVPYTHVTRLLANNPRITAAARFTKYLTTILRLSYDNVKVTIDLRRRLTCKTSYEGRKAFLRYDSLSETVFVNN